MGKRRELSPLSLPTGRTFMNAFKTFVIAMIWILSSLASVEAQEKPQWRNLTEISCGNIFECLTAEEMGSLPGKTLKYRHNRFKEFGYVYLVLKEDGRLQGRNNKGSASGSWGMNENRIGFKTDRWGPDFNFLFYKLKDQVFISMYSDTGGASFVPVAVVVE
jgi:hypothetical protein